jgi:uncharacterized metal-binding protein
LCRSGEGITEKSVLPPYCPVLNFKELIEEIKGRYMTSAIRKTFIQAAVTERECYDRRAAREQGRLVPLRPRIREISEFAKKIDARRIGLAFCSGLAEEAKRAASILEKHGLDVVSVVCSCGAVDKEELGIPAEEKIWREDGYEASCNPLLQAELLNRAETAFNVLVGLCVGHDMMFTSHSNSPVTTLIVKDRFTGHNPVITLFSRYHKDLV